MKIRTGFVSNSSTSSFVCDTEMSLSEIKLKLKMIVDFARNMDLISPQSFFKDIFKKPFIADKKYAKNISHYIEVYKDNSLIDISNKKEDIFGKIIIESASDNTIPYELFDLIEFIFKGERIHLG
jgi:hypothetical protein